MAYRLFTSLAAAASRRLRSPPVRFASPARRTAGTSRAAANRVGSTSLFMPPMGGGERHRSEEHTSELQSLMRISYAVFCLKKKKIVKLQRELLQQINQLNMTHT